MSGLVCSPTTANFRQVCVHQFRYGAKRTISYNSLLSFSFVFPLLLFLFYFLFPFLFLLCTLWNRIIHSPRNHIYRSVGPTCVYIATYGFVCWLPTKLRKCISYLSLRLYFLFLTSAPTCWAKLCFLNKIKQKIVCT